MTTAAETEYHTSGIVRLTRPQLVGTLTGLLLDHLLRVRGSRVVTVSSLGHRIQAAIHFDDLQWEHSYSRVGAYGQSKLANLLFTYELQRRLGAQPGADKSTIAVAARRTVTTCSSSGPDTIWVCGSPPARICAEDPGAHPKVPSMRASVDSRSRPVPLTALCSVVRFGPPRRASS